MSPHHFARLNKNRKISESEMAVEEKVEQALKHAVAIIAAPIRSAVGKNSPIDRDKP
jgi:hypothetical protein